MANKIVGSKDCRLVDVVKAIMSSSTHSVLRDKYPTLALYLDVKKTVTDKIAKDLLHDKITTIDQIMNNLLTEWVHGSEEKPILEELVTALVDAEMNDIARTLEEKFYVQQPSQDSLDSSSSPTHLSKELAALLKTTPEEIDFIKNTTPFPVKVIRPKSKPTRDDKYKLPDGFKGLALLINVTEFDLQGVSRGGATNDINYLKDLCEELGFEPIVHQGHFTAEEVKHIINEFKLKIRILDNEKGVSSCIAFIGSHGEKDYVAMSSGPSLHVYNDFIFEITGIEELKGKPKFIIVNACRNFPIRPSQYTDSLLRKPMTDTMLSFSTSPGFFSNRDPYLGSWYINCLTRVIMKHAHHMHLEEMLDLTEKTMQYILSDAPEGQVPCHNKFLIEPLYFNLPVVS